MKFIYFSIFSIFTLYSALNSQTSLKFYQDIAQQMGNPKILEGKSGRCGFPILLEAYFHGNRAVLNKIQLYRQQTKQTAYQLYQSPSGHFLIHYQTEGFDAIPDYDRNGNGFPDYLEFVANAFDRAWQIEIDSLGFRPPPDENGNPLNTYDIFCKRLSSTQYGATFFDINKDIPALPGKNFTSHIEINLTFPNAPYPVDDPVVRDSMAIAVTAAHEFNHALQLGYNIRFDEKNSSQPFPDLWFIESSATYMEEVVANEVNDYYQFLPYFFQSTNRSLVEGAVSSSALNRIYGETVFYIMLGQLYGKTITREVWEKIIDFKAIDALNEVLKEKGSSLTDALQRLAGWMYFTGARFVPHKFFPEGDQYPSVQIEQTDPYLRGFQKMGANELAPVSFQYFGSDVSAASQLEIFLYHLSNTESWAGAVFDDNDQLFYPFPAFVHFPIDFGISYLPLNFVVVHGLSGQKGGFDAASPDSFRIYLEDVSGSGFSSEVKVYPTIIRPGTPLQQVVFSGLPRNARVTILTANGKLIKEMNSQGTSNFLFWDLANSAGTPVGSGVYIYHISGTGVDRQGKLLVIR